jgi:hypothetical protein
LSGTTAATDRCERHFVRPPAAAGKSVAEIPPVSKKTVVPAHS